MGLSPQSASVCRRRQVQVVDRARLIRARDGERQLRVSNFELRREATRVAKIREPEGFGRFSGILTLRGIESLRAIELRAGRRRFTRHTLACLSELKVRNASLRRSEIDCALGTESIEQRQSYRDCE